MVINSAYNLLEIEKEKKLNLLQECRFQAEQNLSKLRVMDSIALKLKEQDLTQKETNKVLSDLVVSQIEITKSVNTQCEELKRRNDLLEKQNFNQAHELKKQKIWNWITYGITTLIAITSVICMLV